MVNRTPLSPELEKIQEELCAIHACDFNPIALKKLRKPLSKPSKVINKEGVLFLEVDPVDYSQAIKEFAAQLFDHLFYDEPEAVLKQKCQKYEIPIPVLKGEDHLRALERALDYFFKRSTKKRISFWSVTRRRAPGRDSIEVWKYTCKVDSNAFGRFKKGCQAAVARAERILADNQVRKNEVQNAYRF